VFIQGVTQTLLPAAPKILNVVAGGAGHKPGSPPGPRFHPLLPSTASYGRGCCKTGVLMSGFVDIGATVARTKLFK
jgi:hypothetical protein